jgi:hypothetical protein
LAAVSGPNPGSKKLRSDLADELEYSLAGVP